MIRQHQHLRTRRGRGRGMGFGENQDNFLTDFWLCTLPWAIRGGAPAQVGLLTKTAPCNHSNSHRPTKVRSYLQGWSLKVAVSQDLLTFFCWKIRVREDIRTLGSKMLCRGWMFWRCFYEKKIILAPQYQWLHRVRPRSIMGIMYCTPWYQFYHRRVKWHHAESRSFFIMTSGIAFKVMLK